MVISDLGLGEELGLFVLSLLNSISLVLNLVGLETSVFGNENTQSDL